MHFDTAFIVKPTGGLYPTLALLSRLEQRFGVADVRATIGPKLQRWMAEIEALTYFAKTLPPHWKAA